MAGETIITVVGNLTADPEIRTTGNGASVASFTIASTPRTWNRNSNQFEDGQALFMRCSAWRDMAEHCAQSLSKGMRVIAQGRLQQRSYQAQDGSQLRLAFAEFNIADLALAPLAFFGKFFDIHFQFPALGANHSAKSKAFRVVDTAFHIFLQ